MQSMPTETYDRWIAALVPAAKQGNAEAQYRLGIEAMRGDQTQDGITLLTKAAMQGHVLAETALGNLYLVGNKTPADYAKARMWLEKAAAQDNADAEVFLGYIYERGVGVPVDRGTALNWFQKGADHGDTDAKKEIRLIERQQAAEGQSQAQINLSPLKLRCSLDPSVGLAEAMKSGKDSDAETAKQKFEVCMRSNWHRLFGDRPYPEN